MLLPRSEDIAALGHVCGRLRLDARAGPFAVSFDEQRDQFLVLEIVLVRFQGMREQAEQRRRDQAAKKIQTKISDLETRIADREQAMREIEAAMSAPGFYENRDQAQPVIDRHQSLMWELGDLMHRWEELQQELEAAGKA